MANGATYGKAMGGPGTPVRAEAFDGEVPDILKDKLDSWTHDPNWGFRSNSFLGGVVSGEFGERSGANAVQFGGTHYAKRDYQHWDFVMDAGLGYLAGNATKYASRWRDKNGVEDLQKCGHYIVKLRELRADGIKPAKRTEVQREAIDRFCAQLPAVEAELVRWLSLGKYKSAAKVLAALERLALADGG